MSTGRSSRFRFKGPAGSECLGSLPDVPAQRGDSPLTAAGEGRRSRASLGQGNANKMCRKNLRRMGGRGGGDMHVLIMTKGLSLNE